MSFYALRYLPEVLLQDRKHRHTQGRSQQGRFATWDEAEDEREALPPSIGRRLEVVMRDGMGGGRG